MSNLFGDNENINIEAKILFGSKEETRDSLIERINPYTKKVVSFLSQSAMKNDA